MKTLILILSMVLLFTPTACGAKKVAAEEMRFSSDIMPLSQPSIAVNYVSKEEDKYRMVGSHPSYIGTTRAGSCAPLAGANVVGYFDRYYEELIPNHTAGRTLGKGFLYAQEDAEVLTVVNKLYDAMGTTSAGTTEVGFKQGIVSYCQSVGRECTYYTCMPNGKLNYDIVQKSMKNNYPVVLFLEEYNVVTHQFTDNFDHYSYLISAVPHVMVAFGYDNVSYVLTDGGTSYFEFLYVASCNSLLPSGLADLNRNIKLVNAIAISIY